MSVSEVVGLNAWSAGEILDQITVACGNGKVIDMTLPETVKVEGGIDGKVNIYTLTLPDLPNEKEMRAEALADNGKFSRVAVASTVVQRAMTES